MLKKLSLVLCVTLLTGMVGSAQVFATKPSDYLVNEEEEVNIFDTFSGYAATYGTVSTSYAPNGWFTGSKPRLGADFDSDKQSNVVKMGIGIADGQGSDASGCILERNFGKVVDSGKLHFSYNFKSDNTDALIYEISPYDTRPGSESIAPDSTINTPHDPYDWRQSWVSAIARTIYWRTDNPWGNSDGVENPGYITGFENSASSSSADNGNSGLYSSNTYQPDTWYMVDVFYDFDNGTYSIYKDGAAIAENRSLIYKGIKGLHSVIEPGKHDEGGTVVSNNAGGAYTGTSFGYLDNVYVREYKTDKDEITLAADESNNITNVAFSEYMSGKPAKSDISFVNVTTGQAEDFTLLCSSNSGFSVSPTSELGFGTYEISISSGSTLKGAISGASATKSVIIQKSSPLGEAPYYYMNENFNDYQAYTNPANWVFTYASANYNKSRWLMPTTSTSSNIKQTNVTVNTIDNSNAILFDNINNEGTTAGSMQVFHYFPSSTPLTGEFTVEFDVYHENGGWFMGYVLDEDYETTNNNLTQLGTSSADITTWLSCRVNPSMIGMARSYQTGTEAKSPYLGYSGTTLQSDVFTKVGDNIQAPANTWTHVKVKVDTEACSYTFTVGGNTVTVTDSIIGKFMKGITGIKLMRITTPTPSESTPATGKVAFDNVKIYKENSYVMNENFDTYPTALQAGAASIQQNNYPAFVNTNFLSSGGWYDPSNQVEDISIGNMAQQDKIRPKTRAYGVTPMAAASVADSGKIFQAASDSRDNHWTVARATAGERMLSLAGAARTATTDARKGQTRIQKYFDHSIKPGTPFVIKMNMQSFYTMECFGISILGKNDMSVKKGVNSLDVSTLSDRYTSNLLAAWTGNYITATTNNPLFCALIAPNDKISLADINNSSYISRSNIFANSDNASQALSLGQNNASPGSGLTNIIPTSCKMQQVELRITPYYDSNGTAKATINYTFDMGTSYSRGVIQTNQDFMTKESVGIAFDLMGSNWVYAANDYRLALLLDDLQIYEYKNGNVTETQNQYIQSIKAVSYSGMKTDLTKVSEIGTDTARIDINFSSPICADTINKERMISLMKVDNSASPAIWSYFNNAIGYTTSISNDKKTYSIIFNKGNITAGKSYNLVISRNVEFGGDLGSQLPKDYVVLCTASQSASSVGVNNLKVLKPISVFNEPPVDILKPVTLITELDSQSTLNIEGYNTTSGATEIFVCTAFYELTKDGIYRMIEPVFERVAVENYGYFNKTIQLSLPISSSAVLYKAFAWDYPTMKPLIVNVTVQ